MKYEFDRTKDGRYFIACNQGDYTWWFYTIDSFGL